MIDENLPVCKSTKQVEPQISTLRRKYCGHQRHSRPDPLILEQLQHRATYAKVDSNEAPDAVALAIMTPSAITYGQNITSRLRRGAKKQSRVIANGSASAACVRRPRSHQASAPTRPLAWRTTFLEWARQTAVLHRKGGIAGARPEKPLSSADLDFSASSRAFYFVRSPLELRDEAPHWSAEAPSGSGRTILAITPLGCPAMCVVDPRCLLIGSSLTPTPHGSNAKIRLQSFFMLMMVQLFCFASSYSA
jgi:hypothetical protein